MGTLAMKYRSIQWIFIVSLIIGLGFVTACQQQDQPQTQTEPTAVASQEVAANEPAESIAPEPVPTEPATPAPTKEEPIVQEKQETVEEIAIVETSVGTMVLRFFPDVAPGHVENFKKLTREGFYDGTRFHRVISGFMIQGGDPNSKQDNIRQWGTGSPGYSIKAEFNNKPHVKGTLSMARSSDPNSAGSQFFICHGRAAPLDRQYSVFGELMDGMDVLDKIATAPVTRSPSGENSLPVSPVTVKSIKIIPLSEYKKSA